MSQDPPPATQNLPVAVGGQTVALVRAPPAGGVVRTSSDSKGRALVIYPQEPRMPLAVQWGVMTGVAAGWVAGFSALWSLAPPNGWASWLTHAALVAWTAGGSALVARMMRLLQTRGRVTLALGPGRLVAKGTHGLSALNDDVTRAAAASARVVERDGTRTVVVDGPRGEVVLARALPPPDEDWLLETLRSYARGEG